MLSTFLQGYDYTNNFIDTVEDVERLERQTNIRHELIDGQATAMAGATEDHNYIIQNIAFAIRTHLKQLKSSCKVFSETIRLGTRKEFFYPDVFVNCGVLAGKLYAQHPILIIEVASHSTENYDKKGKFEKYSTTFDTLQEYAVVNQNTMQVTVYAKADNWQNAVVYGIKEIVDFDSIGLSIAIEDFYQDVLE